MNRVILWVYLLCCVMTHNCVMTCWSRRRWWTWRGRSMRSRAVTWRTHRCTETSSEDGTDISPIRSEGRGSDMSCTQLFSKKHTHVSGAWREKKTTFFILTPCLHLITPRHCWLFSHSCMYYSWCVFCDVIWELISLLLFFTLTETPTVRPTEGTGSLRKQSGFSVNPL